jgi:hypothetical protein
VGKGIDRMDTEKMEEMSFILIGWSDWSRMMAYAGTRTLRPKKRVAIERDDFSSAS